MEIIYAISGLLGGGVLSYFMWDKALKSKKKKIVSEAVAEGEVIKKDKILQAKEKFLQLKSEHEEYINEKSAKVNNFEAKLKQRESSINQRRDELNREIKDFETSKHEVEVIRENLTSQLDLLEKKEHEVESLHRQHLEKLEVLSGLSAEEAKAQLVDSLKNEAKTEAMSYINEIMSFRSFGGRSDNGFRKFLVFDHSFRKRYAA